MSLSTADVEQTTQQPPDFAPSGGRLRRPPHWITLAAGRGVTVFLGGFTLLNLYGAWRTPGFNANVWWIDVGFLPDALSGLLLVAAGVLLLWWAARPRAGARRRRETLGALLVLVVAALDNVVTFYRVWDAGHIDPRLPLPFSIVVLVALLWLAWLVARSPAAARSDRPSWRSAAVAIAALLACGLLFPLAQFWFFGKTDYRRPADVAVVFGAEVHPGGIPSFSLRDRVATAIDLYRQGLVHAIIMSGGVGASGYNEADVMRTMALQAGVPDAAVLVDGDGVNTQATIDDTVPMFASHGFHSVLAVSHWYHLARIKLTYARAGWDVFTVPSHDTPIPQTPRIVAREVAGFWVYYLRAVSG